MDYLGRINSFSSKKISVPYHVIVQCSDKEYEGTIMPSSENTHLILKLDNGYNIGIDFKKIKKIIPKSKEKVVQQKISSSFKKTLPTITIIATGGTIASRVDYKTGAVTSLSSPEEFLSIAPELRELCNLKLLMPFTKLSEDMSFSDYEILSEQVFKSLKGSEGIIVTHGTDTLHFTSSVLSFALKDLNKPVAVVGAQRSSDRGSADGVMNLVCAVHYCLSNIAEVSVVMHGSVNDDYCFAIPGTRARKMHTERRDAFRPVNAVPFAKIWKDGKIEILNKSHKTRSDKREAELINSFSENVAIIKAYPNSEPGIIDYLFKKGIRGFVVEGTGFGHVPVNSKKSWESVLKKYSDKAFFVQTSQCIYGRTSLTVYSNSRKLKDLGFISGSDLIPETAYIKLAWILGQTKSRDKVKELMETDLRGELSGRSLVETFMY